MRDEHASDDTTNRPNAKSDRGVLAWLARVPHALDHLRSPEPGTFVGPDDEPPHDVAAAGCAWATPRRTPSEATPSEARREPAAVSSCLEPEGKNRGEGEREADDGGELVNRLEVHACKCKSRFCCRCCIAMGLKLRERLLPVLETFTSLQMWTLTVDPALFGSPREAFDYCKAEKVVNELVRSLRKAGVLHSDRYFYVVEWQKESQMVHYHLMLDASYVPKSIVNAAWDRFRPKWAGPPEGARPPFGATRFSKPMFANATHAACYACKYLIKHPEHGYPQWVMQSTGNIKRYGHSRGFFKTPESNDAAEEREARRRREHGPGCLCDKCRDRRKKEKPKRCSRTIEERLADCGVQATLVRCEEVELPGGEIVKRWTFLDTLRISFDDVLAALDCREVKQRCVIVNSAEADWLKQCGSQGSNYERIRKYVSRNRETIDHVSRSSESAANLVANAVATDEGRQTTGRPHWSPGAV